ncbi:CKL6, partial [Symbiodinium sp. KB8]
MALLDPAEWVGKTVGGWKIDEHLGGGGFGQAGAQYAMKLVQKHVVTKRGKVQKKESQESAALCLERRMYANWLKQQTAVPKLAPGQNYGVQGQGAEAVRYMVLQKCTSMLSHVLQSHPDGLPAADVALLGLQLVRADLLRAFSALPQTLCAAHHTQMPVLKHLHSKGFVYVDMKADNIMFGLPPHEHQAYLLDYGCSQMYRNLFGKDKFQAPNANGTTLYISTWAHDFQAPHPRNDLLSLAYLLCQCANGSLPWQFERSEAALIAAKRACSPADMAGAVPALAEFVRTVQELDLCSVEQLPYARLERILTSLAPASGRYSSCIVADGAAPAKAPAAGAAAATAATGGSRRKR